MSLELTIVIAHLFITAILLFIRYREYKIAVRRAHEYFIARRLSNPRLQDFQEKVWEFDNDVPWIVMILPLVNLLPFTWYSLNIFYSITSNIISKIRLSITKNITNTYDLDKSYLPKEYITIEKDNNINNKDAGKISIVDTSNTRGKVSLSSKE